ncbi:hypothetical protein [Apibacter sp. HY039]|uniref:hypothetical protein n=1 Tax=Apibacter sp. HY039 TaxID=2501476 RepID=UPI000FEB8090|nr:hypothetical protein [Apibacter sp. HY039]
MIKKFLLLGVISLFTVLTSCSSDDDKTKTLTIDEQNAADDASIVNFLDNYYFDDLGKVTKFTETVTSKDKDPLRKNAKKDASGFWYVPNPAVTSASGTKPNGSNNILLHYTLNYYVASEGGSGYSSQTTASSSIDGLGIAQQNPSFYKKPSTDTTNVESYYVIKGIVDGLKYFSPTNKSKNDPYDVLQGVIIVPSRLAYARNSNYMSLSNATFVLNFELYKVCAEGVTCE